MNKVSLYQGLAWNIDAYDPDIVYPWVLSHGLDTLIDMGPSWWFENDNRVNIVRMPYLLINHDYDRMQKMAYRPAQSEKKSVFNFTVNKPTLPRHILLKTLEYLGLRTETYTWSGHKRERMLDSIMHDMPDDPDFRKLFLAPIETPARYLMGDADIIDNDMIITEGDYALIQDIFDQSCISIISESTASERSALKKQCHFSEKTLYAMAGCTFPIWVGGYAQADTWKSLGYDIFEDVIDHSYQYRENLWARCWYAVYDNLHLLTDLRRSRELVAQHWARLIDNRDKVIDPNTTKKLTADFLAACPENIRDVCASVMADKIPPDEWYYLDLNIF